MSQHDDRVTLLQRRHHLVHGYDRVDLDRLWVIAERDLPPLIDSVASILETRQ